MIAKETDVWWVTRCDACTRKAPTVSRKSEEAAHLIAAKAGWTLDLDGNDYCPTCWAELQVTRATRHLPPDE